MILNDSDIALWSKHGMITPFVDHKTREIDGQSVTSFGLGHYGYDITLADEILFPICPVFDLRSPPSDLDYRRMLFTKEFGYELDPGEMVLGRSIETFNMPPHITGIALGKSTWARLGLFVNITPLEAGWHGTLTIEMSNIGHVPILIFPFWGIAQVLFFAGEPSNTTYGDGKYQGQRGVVGAKI